MFMLTHIHIHCPKIVILKMLLLYFIVHGSYSLLSNAILMHSGATLLVKF